MNAVIGVIGGAQGVQMRPLWGRIKWEGALSEPHLAEGHQDSLLDSIAELEPYSQYQTDTTAELYAA